MWHCQASQGIVCFISFYLVCLDNTRSISVLQLIVSLVGSLIICAMLFKHRFLCVLIDVMGCSDTLGLVVIRSCSGDVCQGSC